MTDRSAATGRARPAHRVGATATSLLLLVTLAACTGDDDPASTPSPSPSASRVPTETAAPPPPPAKVRVTRVSGRLGPRDQEVLAKRVGAVVTSYFDDAFLDGDYPRSDFGDAFATFTAGAARRAGRAQEVLTNASLGPTTEQVVPRRQTAYLSVLAPKRIAAGVTAKVGLQYVAERGDRPDQLVTVRGRLLLSRDRDGDWKIFGYDLDRSSRPATEGS